MELTEVLTSKPPRETSGSSTASRFEFQKNWALCKLLELYKNAPDFLVLLDYHEDIVILDHESRPSRAEFCQVKTKKSGTWTVAALTNKPKNKDGFAGLSILEKLYTAHTLCNDGASKLCFVSNAAVKVRLKDKTKKQEVEHCTFQDLDASEKYAIHRCIEGEHVSISDYIGLNKLETTRTHLSLNDHETHTKGKLVAFLETLFPDTPVQTTAVYRSLLDEIRRKTNNNAVYTNFIELSKVKGIASSEFREIIHVVGKRLSADALWTMAQDYLIHEALAPATLKRIRTGFYNYAVSHMNPADEYLQKLSSAIKVLLNENKAALEPLALGAQAELVVAALREQKVAGDYTAEYLQAATIYEVLDETVPETDTKSTEAPA